MDDDDYQIAMSKGAGPDYKGRWEMKDLLLDFFQSLLAVQGVTSESMKYMMINRVQIQNTNRETNIDLLCVQCNT